MSHDADILHMHVQKPIQINSINRPKLDVQNQKGVYRHTTFTDYLFDMIDLSLTTLWSIISLGMMGLLQP